MIQRQLTAAASLVILSFAADWFAHDFYKPLGAHEEYAHTVPSDAEAELTDQNLIDEVLSASPPCVRDTAAAMAAEARAPVTEATLYKAEAKCLMEKQSPGSADTSTARP